MAAGGDVGVGAWRVAVASGEASVVTVGVSGTGEASMVGEPVASGAVGEATATTCPSCTVLAIVLKMGQEVCSQVSVGPMAHIPYQSESLTVAAM